MVNDSVNDSETAQFVHVIDWFIFYANSIPKFDRSCQSCPWHTFTSDDVVDFKGRPTVVFYEQYSLYDDNLLLGI